MTDPLTVTIAAAIAGKAVELAGEPARDAVAAIVRKVRDKLRGRPRGAAALEGLAAEPDSPERLAAFDAELRAAIADDPEFGAELRALSTTVHVDRGGVANVFQGRADKSVQLRDVQGGLHIQ